MVELVSVPPPETVQVTPAFFASFVTVAVTGTICAWSMLFVLPGVNATAIGGVPEEPHPDKPNSTRTNKPESHDAAARRFTIPLDRRKFWNSSRSVRKDIVVVIDPLLKLHKYCLSC